MSALGAKPNHGFFNCQHPAPGNPCTNILSSRRVASLTLARERGHGRPRRKQPSVPSNQNIFFSAVSCSTRETFASTRRPGRHLARHPGMHRSSDERESDFFSSSGRFSAPHNPDCAKLRKPFGAKRRRSTRAGTTSTRTRRWRCRHRRMHSRAAIDARDRNPPGSMTTISTATGCIDDRRTAHSRTDAGIRKRKSRPRFHGRLPSAPGPGAMSRCDQ